MTYKFLGAQAWHTPFEKEFATDTEALEYRFKPELCDGRWYAAVWKKSKDPWSDEWVWLYWDEKSWVTYIQEEKQ